MANQVQQQLQPNAASIFAALAAELDGQCRCLGELDALSQRQAALIGMGDGTDLLALMSERQQVIDDLARLALRTEPLRRTWDELKPPPPDSMKNEIERRSSSIVSMLCGVRERDELDRQTLHQRREEIRQELQRIESSKRAVGAYGAPAASVSKQEHHA